MSEVVVVTGASAGIGRATAIAFGRKGARVGLLARGDAGLQAAAEEVRAAGGEALPIVCDVTDAGAVERAAAEVERTFGPIDIWVNNAMAAVLGEVLDTDAEEFRRVMETTYLGSVHGTLAALRRMVPRDRGTIVQVGSALAFRGIPLQATYCAAKHACKGFVESLRTELRHRGSHVHLTMVQLPGVNTTQFESVRLKGLHHRPQPVAPYYQPEVAARAIVWAAHHRRRSIWVGLPTVYTILGNRIAPWLGDRYLAKTGYKGQMSDAPASPSRPDYLEAPLDDGHDRGFHGPYDEKANTRSAQLWLTTHRRELVGASAGAAAAAAVLVARR